MSEAILNRKGRSTQTIQVTPSGLLTTPTEDLTSEPQPSDKSDLWNVYKQSPTPTTLRTVVDKLEPTISKAVRVYAPNIKSDIVNQRARIIAAEAVKSYNPKMGANLQTHVIRQLQRLQQLAPKIMDPLPMPERFRREQMLVYQHSKDLEDTLGREPTREELVHASRIPKARIDKILRLAHARIPSSVYEDAQDDDDEGKDLVSESDPDMVWREAVYHGLGDVDKYIFEHKLGYEGAKILDTNHMAMKLRMSPSAISQRAGRIQQQLDQAHVGY